jgi:hypothetical protein
VEIDRIGYKTVLASTLQQSNECQLSTQNLTFRSRPSCGHSEIIYCGCMRTMYTDRYAVQIWLPLLVGGGFVWQWSDHPRASIVPLFTGVFWLFVAAIALVKRQRRRSGSR